MARYMGDILREKLAEKERYSIEFVRYPALAAYIRAIRDAQIKKLNAGLRK